MDDLRDLLFESIRQVKDGKMPLDRAKAVGDLTQVMVNTAKVEVEFIKATKGKGRASGFLGEQAPHEPKPLAPGELPPGFVGRREHRIGDDEPEQE
jgi:hypothetical protein